MSHESKLDITELDIIKANTTFRGCQNVEVLSQERLFDMSQEEKEYVFFLGVVILFMLAVHCEMSRWDTRIERSHCCHVISHTCAFDAVTGQNVLV